MPLSKPKEEGNFRKTIETISRTKSSVVTVFSDFVRIAACAVACQTREDEYFEVIRRYAKEEQRELANAFAYLVDEMEDHPFCDVLGEYYQIIASKASRDGRGEFFTPEAISELMARISLNAEEVIEKGNPITLGEPTCGAGGMILQVAKQLSPERTGLEESYVDLLRVTAQDISPVACDMTYINTSLWGIPARVLLGNTLTNEVTAGWKNIHWLRVGEDWRQNIAELETLMGQEPPENLPEPRLEPVSTPQTFDYTMAEQQVFDL